MKRNFLKLIATSPLWLCGKQGFTHGNQSHSTAAPSREQKPWGIAGDAGAVQRSVTVTMSDRMRFSPDHLALRLGETVRLRIHNQGALLHELVLGDRATLDAHAALMLKFPDMEHDEPYMAHVPAGKTGGIVWHFNRAGQFEFACLIAGHYQAGMVGRISVAP
ncbi:MAG: hypothetical protein RLZZ401_1295 [Pseudomonadota bacterium]|jgi:uncharacterized cupredoxin-like copper-binding protein